MSYLNAVNNQDVLRSNRKFSFSHGCRGGANDSPWINAFLGNSSRKLAANKPNCSIISEKSICTPTLNQKGLMFWVGCITGQ